MEGGSEEDAACGCSEDPPVFNQEQPLGVQAMDTAFWQ